jgi:SAM-dependent methyltransferase
MHATGTELYRGLGAIEPGAHMDLPGQLEHCRRTVARFGEPVLEIGSGYGRITLAMVAEGIDIDGCDLSLDMLGNAARAARRRGLGVTLYWQAMQDLDLPRRYRTILVPSAAFMYLTDPSEGIESLKRIHDHLLPGGGLLLAVGVHPMEGRSGSIWRAPTRVNRSGTDGASLTLRSSGGDHDPFERIERRQDEYRLERDGQTIRAERRTGWIRHYTGMELAVMLAWIGYVDLELDRIEAGAKRGMTDCLIVTARRRS